jgi:hypothetical protein
LTTNLAIRYNYIYEKQHLLLSKTGQKNNAEPKIKFSVYGGEKGIRTPDTVFTVYMISNHAPSASSDISPNDLFIISNEIRKIK